MNIGQPIGNHEYDRIFGNHEYEAEHLGAMNLNWVFGSHYYEADHAGAMYIMQGLGAMNMRQIIWEP